MCVYEDFDKMKNNVLFCFVFFLKRFFLEHISAFEFSLEYIYFQTSFLASVNKDIKCCGVDKKLHVAQLLLYCKEQKNHIKGDTWCVLNGTLF